MSTELERRLREAFDADAARARLANPEAPAARSREADVRRRRRTTRRLGAIAAAIALVALVAAGTAVLQRDRDRRVEVTDSVPTRIFTDVAPGEVVPLPAGPLSGRVSPASVWSGTELIVWGGDSSGHPDERTYYDDGAAFDLATGTWRRIAPAPIDRRTHATAVWTGTEMVVWGGIRDVSIDGDGVVVDDGAAYNPATDSWRRLADAPIPPAYDGSAVWTGEEVVVMGGTSAAGRAVNHVAAYDPEADAWRDLADAPSTPMTEPVWTGSAILTTLPIPAPLESEPVFVLARYDLRTDTWRLDEDARYVTLVGVPDAQGVASTALALPHATAAPVAVLDGAGTTIETLPGVSADPGEFGDRVGARARWVGDVALFSIRGEDWWRPEERPAAWALDPEAETSRLLPEPLASLIESALATTGDVLLAVDPDAENAEFFSAVLYRAPTG